MAYRHTNSKGVSYYLNAKKVTPRGGKAQTIYYFSRHERRDTGVDLPDDRVVNENPRNGFLTLKRYAYERLSESSDVPTELPDNLELALSFAPDGLSVAYLDDTEIRRLRAPDGTSYDVRSVYVASLFGSEACVDRLERLVRSGAPESALQECLEECEELVRIFGHRDAVPHVVIEGAEGDLIPDFVLRPVANDLCDLLEIKKPSLTILTGTERRPQLAYRLSKAVKQLHEYAEALDSPAVRSRVAERYELDFFRPRLYLVAGRAASMDPVRLKRALYPDDRTEIVNWDEFIARARDRSAWVEATQRVRAPPRLQRETIRGKGRERAHRTDWATEEESGQPGALVPLRSALRAAVAFPIPDDVIEACLDGSHAEDVLFRKARRDGLASIDRTLRSGRLALITGHVAESVAQVVLEQHGYSLLWDLSAPGGRGVDLVLLSPDENLLALEVMGTLRAGVVPSLARTKLRKEQAWLEDAAPGMTELPLTPDDAYFGVMAIDLALGAFRLVLSSDFTHFVPIRILDELHALHRLR